MRCCDIEPEAPGGSSRPVLAARDCRTSLDYRTVSCIEEGWSYMSVLTPSQVVPAPGGSFLLESRQPAEVFTPEDLSEEQRQIAATAAQFGREGIFSCV